jgi:methylase of polypeptide subunit release factors
LPATCLELGCGLALPSIVLQGRGASVLATDYNEDALQFAMCNSLRNGAGELRTQCLDWRRWPAELERFELIFAADVLYEQRK